MQDVSGVFYKVLKEIAGNQKVRELRNYPQHIVTNSYHHSVHVALMSYIFARKLHWRINERDLAIGAMLHDFYLYDIAEKGMSDYRHGVSHPMLALENARRYFDLSMKAENIIVSHMWPLTFWHFPASKEAILVCLADKYCAVEEMFLWKKRRHNGMSRDVSPTTIEHFDE